MTLSGKTSAIVRRVAFGVAILGAAQGTMFLLQSWYIYRENYADLLTLVKLVGLFNLAFLIFDGNSGVVFVLARASHDEEHVVAGYYHYRSWLICIVALIAIGSLLSGQKDALWISVGALVSFLFRIWCIDGELDQKGRQNIALALSTAWIPATCVLALLSDSITVFTVSAGAVLGSAIHLAGFSLSGAGPSRKRLRLLLRGERDVVRIIIPYMGTHCVGQVYSRLSLFLLATFFSGPLAVLIAYGKNTFNVVGTVTFIARRAEMGAISDREDSVFRLRNFRISLAAQAVFFAAICPAIIWATPTSGLPLALGMLIIVYQLFEKWTANVSFFDQVMGGHRSAYVFICCQALLGTIMYFVAREFADPLLVVYAELLTFSVYNIYWLLKYSGHRKQSAEALSMAN